MNGTPHAIAHAQPHAMQKGSVARTVDAKRREEKGREVKGSEVKFLAEFQDQCLLSQGSRRVIGLGASTC